MEDISKYINEEMNKIEIQVTETKEEFIFNTIYPFCVSVIPPQEILNKRDLEQALIKYFPKKIQHNATLRNVPTCPSCGNAVGSKEKFGEQDIFVQHKYCLFCGQHLDWE